MEFLFAKPLAKEDVIKSLRSNQTISEPVRQKALELAERFKSGPAAPAGAGQRGTGAEADQATRVPTC